MKRWIGLKTFHRTLTSMFQLHIHYWALNEHIILLPFSVECRWINSKKKKSNLMYIITSPKNNSNPFKHQPTLSQRVRAVRVFFQKLLKAEANRRVRMYNLQSAKRLCLGKNLTGDSNARAQEIKNLFPHAEGFIYTKAWVHGPFVLVWFNKRL